MATVLGELEIEFESATLTQLVERAAEPSTVEIDLWALALDLPALVDQWGPVTAIRWEVSLAAVPVPASAWLLATALAWLAWRRE